MDTETLSKFSELKESKDEEVDETEEKPKSKLPAKTIALYVFIGLAILAVIISILVCVLKIKSCNSREIESKQAVELLEKQAKSLKNTTNELAMENKLMADNMNNLQNELHKAKSMTKKQKIEEVTQFPKEEIEVLTKQKPKPKTPKDFLSEQLKKQTDEKLNKIAKTEEVEEETTEFKYENKPLDEIDFPNSDDEMNDDSD